MRPYRDALRRPGWIGGLWLGLLMLSFAACAWVSRQPQTGSDSLPRMLWPDPPDRPRIELLTIFTRPSDLGIQPSVWTRLASVVTGSHELQLQRPSGIAASRGRLAIADPGTASVQLYDLNQRSAVAISACGEEALTEPVAAAFLGESLYVSDASAGKVYVFDRSGECLTSWQLDPGSRPAGLAADPTRMRIYVADVGAHQVLGFDARGERVVCFGRRGSQAGEFNYPTWLAVDAAGDLYVTDALNFRVQILDAQGQVLGGFGRQGDGSGLLARPKGIAVDADGHIYLVDALFDAVQLFDRSGQYLMVFGSRGHSPGHFWLPAGVALDGDRIYVADAYNQRVQVFRFLGGEP